MRPSSSTSEPGGLFDGVLAAGSVRAAVADPAWLRALLDVEAALAVAAGRVGLVPEADAAAVAAACADMDVDAATIAAVGAEAAGSGTPVVPLVQRLRAAVPDDAARAVHVGATSQDIMDSAAMLVAHRALGPLLADLQAAADACAALADRHRDTLVTGRTLLQQALPLSFGLVAAGWLAGLDRARRRLAAIRAHGLAAQLGGAVGTLAGYGDEGVALLRAFAAEVGLAEPNLPWHTERTRIADLAGALGAAAGAMAKVARDIALSAQTEVGELAEGGGEGGSSTLPHKHNPIRAIAAAAAAAQAPGLVATLMAAMPHEHERAAGSWHAEWRPLRALLESTGSAASQLRVSLEGLRVDTGRMRSNLDRSAGTLLAERVAGALRPALGAEAAHAVVREAAAAGTLSSDPRITAHLSPARIADLLDPAGYLGSAGALIDRALAAARAPDDVPRDLGVVVGAKADEPRERATTTPRSRGVVNVFYRVDGPADGPPLLMINSLGADLRMWEPQVPALSRRHRMIRYDARGHGRSPVPDGRYSLADLGRDALALLDRLDVASADICGLSLGGMTAMWLAAHEPDRVRRLVLCCTSALLGPPEGWVERAATVRSHGTEAIADATIARWVTPAWAAAHPDATAELRAMVAATPAIGYAGACAAVEEMDLRPDLIRISAPTTVLAGADDPSTPPEHAAAIVAGIRDARMHVLDDAAHLATYERPDIANRLILETLDD
jgi:3-carboxy-cis,cis-muconate cycloisomerase/3-oxoadipate enol-lactonase